MKEMRLGLLGVLISLTLNVFAQNTKAIDLTTVLQLVDANSLILDNHQLQQQRAAANLNDARSWWLPTIYAGVKGHGLSGAAMNTDGRFAVDTERDNLWLGLGFDVDWDFGNSIFKTKEARYNYEAMKFKSQVDRNNTILETIDTYYDLLTAQMAYTSYQDLAGRAENLYEQMEVRSASGLSYESDVLIARSNLNHLKIQMLDWQFQWREKGGALSRMLALRDANELISSDTILALVELVKEEDLVKIEVNLNIPEMGFAQNYLESLQSGKRSVTIGMALPTLRVNGYLSSFGDLNDNVVPLDPVLFPETEQMYRTDAINAQLMWNIPLGELFYRGKGKEYQARIGQAKNAVAQIQIDAISNASLCRAQLLATKEQVELAEESAELSSRALEQCIAREENGIARPMELLQAQEVYIKSRLDYIRSVASYNKASYKYFVVQGGNL